MRLALGEILPSEKKFSRRRRKTLGKDEPSARSLAACRSDASDGTRSSISGFRLIITSAGCRVEDVPPARKCPETSRARPRSMLTDFAKLEALLPAWLAPFVG